MKLYKILFGFTLLFSFQTTLAQKTFYPFTFRDNVGLTDSLNVELIKPAYDNYRISKNKKLYVFNPQYSSDSPPVVFDAESGLSSTKFKSASLDDIVINDQSYHYFDDGKKSFLQNSDTDDVVKTAEDIYSIKNLGSQFIVGKYFPADNETTSAKSGGKDKNGFLLPPKPRPFYTNDYVFYSNKLPLKSVLKIEADAYMPFYTKNEIDADYIKNIKQYNSVNFDYLLFKKGKQLILYDQNLKLIKKIPFPKAKEDDKIDEEFATAQISKIVGKPVYYFYKIPPNMGNGSRPDSEKKRDAFELKKSGENLYELIRTKDDKVCFTTNIKTNFYIENYRIRMDDDNNKTSYFYINRETGRPFSPVKYLKLLQIKIMQ